MKSKNKKKTNKKSKALIPAIAVVLAIVILAAVLVPTVFIPSGKYKEAIALLEKDNYNAAAEIFTELKGFKDSEEKLAAIPEMKFAYALKLVQAQEYARAVTAYEDACLTDVNTESVKEMKYKFAVCLLNVNLPRVTGEIFVSLGDYKDSAEQWQELCVKQLLVASKGSLVPMGMYEQDGIIGNGTEMIEWLVIDKTETEILVISQFALDSMRYADKVENFTWEKSDIRKWLNGDFYNTVFNEWEKEIIMTSDVSGEVSKDFGKSLDFVVKDKLYLPNWPEACGFWVNDPAKATTYTEYAKNDAIEGCSWWLREHYGACVAPDGTSLHGSDNSFLDRTYYVRPVMRISLESIT